MFFLPSQPDRGTKRGREEDPDEVKPPRRERGGRNRHRDEDNTVHEDDRKALGTADGAGSADDDDVSIVYLENIGGDLPSKLHQTSGSDCAENWHTCRVPNVLCVRRYL